MIVYLPYVVVSLLYLGVAATLWQKQRHPITKPFNGRHLVALGIILHGGLLYIDIDRQHVLFFGLINAFSVTCWITLLIYWLASLQYQIKMLPVLMLPPAAAAVLLQRIVPDQHILTYPQDVMVAAHFIIALLTYGLFTFAAFHAVLIAMVEKNLHRKKTWLLLSNMPSVMDMEALLFQVIKIGFILLTLTVVSGIMFSQQLFHQPWQWNHKSVFSVLSWITFAILLYGHKQYGWRGMLAIRWTLSGFGFLLLAYLGTRFVLEVILHR